MKSLLSKTLLILCCTACTGGALMTMQSFADVPIGAAQSEVLSAAGTPDTIRKTKEGTVEYEYVERIKAGGRDIETRYYIFVIKDEKVTSKRIRQGSPSPYEYDSFDMQTTKNERP